MPDWFYRTVTRPILFRLPAERARNFALGFMARLCRLPLGPALIDFLGHMRADSRLALKLMGMTLPAPVGIGPGLDARAVALPALARFGAGFIEVGPVTLAGSAGATPLERLPDQQAIWRPEPQASLALGEALAVLREVQGRGVPMVVRVAAAAEATHEQAAAEFDHVVPRLAEVADVLAVEGVSDSRQLERILSLVRSGKVPRPVLLVVTADLDLALLESAVGSALEVGAAGVLVDGSMRAPPGARGAGRVYGLPALAQALQQVRRIREHWQDLAILASGGIHEPEYALEMMLAGANLVSTDTGLIFSGPGLPKRMNEAILYARHGRASQPAETARPAERSWFWTTLVGAGMVIGSLTALAIAATRVILPYDEQFAGMTRAELERVNPRLLSFLAHDRVSLAGAMVAIGTMYLGLSLFGIRRGLHWAQQSVFWSAFTGFATFFLFLGYGYLDTFHAFVTVVLLQFLLLGLHAPLGPPAVPESPALNGDWRWRMSLWGQLILIGHAGAVIVAGLVIAFFGVTRVFVPEDLEFMQTTAEALREANPRLLPLIAHDRATFGGMLVSAGLVLLLPALWGFRPCSAWLWWTQFVAVILAYAAAITVHMAVGYTNLWHLTPAYGGLALFLLGLALSYPYLCRPGATAAEWKRFCEESETA
jgi:dihydroorotate dehydrogenase